MRKAKLHYNITKQNLLNCAANNMSQREIAAHFNVCRDFIRSLFKEYNIEITNRRKNKPIDRDVLIEEHHKNNLTLKEISIKYKRSYPSIKHMVKKFHIDVRNNVVEKNRKVRNQKIEDIKNSYGKLTKLEIQKKFSLGQAYVDEFLEGTKSPHFRQSSYEREIIEFLSNLDIIAEANNRTAIPPKEIDVYIPLARIGIEFHGLYWHQVGNHKKVDKYTHRDKADIAEKSNIHLLQFFEDEWLNKKDLCKSMISQRLGFGIKIHGRKCVVEKITPSEAKNFTIENHLQGHCNASIYLGLKYQGELISMMSFRIARFGKTKSAWELIRYCTKQNYSIHGGASKIFKSFVELIKPEIVHSYADKRISVGGVYKQLGFNFIHNTNPNYYYVIGKIRSNRMNWQKKLLAKKLKDYNNNLTEIENMALNNMFPIYDAGHKLFVWKCRESS